MKAELLRPARQCLCLRARALDGGLGVAAKMLTSLIGSISDGGPKGQSFRIAAQERLWEYQQLRAGRRCLMASQLDLLQGRRGIKQHTSYLCDGSSNHNFMLNVGIGKMRTLVEGPRTRSEGFRSDGQTGTSDVDHRPKHSLSIGCTQFSGLFPINAVGVNFPAPTAVERSRNAGRLGEHFAPLHPLACKSGTLTRVVNQLQRHAVIRLGIHTEGAALALCRLPDRKSTRL